MAISTNTYTYTNTYDRYIFNPNDFDWYELTNMSNQMDFEVKYSNMNINRSLEQKLLYNNEIRNKLLSMRKYNLMYETRGDYDAEALNNKQKEYLLREIELYTYDIFNGAIFNIRIGNNHYSGNLDYYTKLLRILKSQDQLRNVEHICYELSTIVDKMVTKEKLNVCNNFIEDLLKNVGFDMYKISNNLLYEICSIADVHFKDLKINNKDYQLELSQKSLIFNTASVKLTANKKKVKI